MSEQTIPPLSKSETVQARRVLRFIRQLPLALLVLVVAALVVAGSWRVIQAETREADAYRRGYDRGVDDAWSWCPIRDADPAHHEHPKVAPR